MSPISAGLLGVQHGPEQLLNRTVASEGRCKVLGGKRESLKPKRTNHICSFPLLPRNTRSQACQCSLRMQWLKA
ncbi:hypothetical protein CEXT_788141 [Caerostris extrusa]|uniref:Uncharacterized protein n=1 Tax=Caerostris extrusa TaxID=172846 RepID=A0AAV4TGC3_CAEEX|nr:hypothetical protein CEXT_788141 [Caerostris extrusa]